MAVNLCRASGVREHAQARHPDLRRARDPPHALAASGAQLAAQDAIALAQHLKTAQRASQT